MLRRPYWIFPLVLAGVLTLWSCDALNPSPDLGLNQNLPVFSVDLFEANIQEAFAGSTMGFTYAIAVGGDLERSGAAGSGITSPDGSRAMNVNDRMHIASISKTITTIAVLRLVQDTTGVTLDTSIGSYLPDGWPAGPGVNGLTFRDLLLHQSGFSFPANQSRFSHADLRTLIGTGVVGDSSDPVYSNSHHALFRIIVPNVLETPTLPGESEIDYYARAFGEYVEDVVFDPLGITASVTPPANPNRYYSWPHDGTAGLGTDANWLFSTDFGPYGWYLSAVDLVKILSYLHQTEVLISEEMRAVMNQDEMGYWNSRTGDKGRYLLKQGGWAYTTDSITKGMQSIAGHFPGGIDAAVIVNSRISPPFNMASVLRDAFDASFVDP